MRAPARQGGRFLVPHSGEGRRPACRAELFVQHHDGTWTTHCGGQEKERLESELEIAREVQNQLSEGRSLRQDPGAERRAPGAWFRATTTTSWRFPMARWPSPSATWPAKHFGGAADGHHQSAMRSQLSTRMEADSIGFAGADGVEPEPAALCHHLARKYATFYFALYDESTHALT